MTIGTGGFNPRIRQRARAADATTPAIRCIDRLAIFGGSPLLSSPTPAAFLPDIESYLGLLDQIFEHRRLTNDGALVQRLEDRLGRHHRKRHCVALANAGLGFMMLLQLLAGGRRGEVIMPALADPGLPHFIDWAGQTPRFCDVDKDTHALDPQSVAAAIGERTIAILAVCGSLGPGDITGLCRVAAARHIPVVCDATAAFATTGGDRDPAKACLAAIFSLDATTLLNGFEGGYVATDDDGVAAALRWQRNFCLPLPGPGERPPPYPVLGLNAKLNELHAAMALLSLDRLGERLAAEALCCEAYRRMCSRLPGWGVASGSRGGWAPCAAVATVRAPWPLSRDQTVALLRAEEVAVSPYRSPALHLAPGRSGSVSGSALPVAESLAGDLLQLPGADAISPAAIATLGEYLASVAAHGAAIAARLAARGIA